MANTTEVTIGTEQAKRSLQELQAVADSLEAKLKSIGSAMGGGNASQADSANFFQTAGQLSSVRSQMSSTISGSAMPGAGGGAGSPFSSSSNDNPFGPPQFKMQKLGDVQAATDFVMKNSDGNAREYLMSQVLSGSIPVAMAQAMGRVGGGGDGAFKNFHNAYNLYNDSYSHDLLNSYKDFEQAGLHTNDINRAATNALAPGGINWLNYPGSPANPNEYGPAAPGSQGYKSFYANAQNVADTRSRQMQAFGMAVGFEAAHSISAFAGAYTQSVVTGNSQPMAYGAAYGQAGGFAAGAGIGAAIGSTVPGVGTIVGAGVGGLIGGTIGGPIINALQAPSVARAATELSLAPMAQQNGLDAGVLADKSQAIAVAYNASKMATASTEEKILREGGTYTGNDQASEQDVASIMSALSGGYLQSGVDSNYMDLGGQAANLIRSAGGGKLAINKANSIAKVQAAMGSTGGNFSAIISKVGLPDFLTAASEWNLAPGIREGLIQTQNDLQRTSRETGIANSLGEIGVNDYAASGMGGRTLEQRNGQFNAMTSGIRGRISALDAEIAVNNNAPGGVDPAFDAAKKAMRSAAAAELADEYTKRAQNKVGQVEAVGGAHIAEAGVALAYANIYGAANSFAKPTAALSSALSSEENDLRAAMSDSHLPYADKMRARARLAEIGQQINALPSQQAAAEFSRRNITGDVLAANQGVLSNQANLYGSNSDVESAAASSYNIQRGIFADALTTLHNPGASVETRGQAALRADNAQNASLQIKAGTRQTIINRIEQSASANQAELGVGMAKAQFGSGADVRMAGAGLVAAYGVEEGRLNEQLNAPGTTVEQKTALRSRIAGLQSQSINLTESTRDLGFQKDFISKYEITATKLQGQAQRQELLPFSPGNMMVTSLKMLQNNQVGLKMLDEREADYKKSGTYSPERELEIETQRQNLQTSSAQQIAFLGNDLPNRLPAMAAGKPSFTARFNSFELAAMAVRGTAIRSFGAVGGGQLKDQNALTDPFMSESGLHSRSTTQEMNNGGSSGVIAAIEKLINVVQGQSGHSGSMRPSEAAGAVATALYGKKATLENGRPN